MENQTLVKNIEKRIEQLNDIQKYGKLATEDVKMYNKILEFLGAKQEKYQPHKVSKDEVQLLKSEGLSQKQVAGKLNVSVSTVYRNWK